MSFAQQYWTNRALYPSATDPQHGLRRVYTPLSGYRAFVETYVGWESCAPSPYVDIMRKPRVGANIALNFEHFGANPVSETKNPLFLWKHGVGED